MYLAIGCVSPPMPPSSRNLVRIFKDRTIIEFGETVSYLCHEGHHFHRSFTQSDYKLTCLRDGNFTKLDPLEYCVHPRGNQCCLLLHRFIIPPYKEY